MLKAKTKSKAPETSASLAARIEQARAEAEAFVEAKVRELKASPEGQSLPIDWLRHDLRGRHGSHHCHCRVALSLLSQEHD